jgi:hypothetical protein
MADSWFDRLERRFEVTHHPTQLIAGVCESYTLEQTKKLLDQGVSITRHVKTTTTFAKYTNVFGEAGDKLADAAQGLDRAAKKSKTLVGDVKSACEISEAIAVLNRWVLEGSTISNQDAAKAFDKLFGGAANFFEKLPPPINQYARILSSVADFKFFSHMQDMMDPESPNTPRGRQLREIMQSMDR